MEQYDETIEIYIKYESLDVYTISTILSSINRIHGAIIDSDISKYSYRNGYSNYLELTEIHTGESIKFKLTEKWKAGIRVKDGDIEVKLPKKIGVPSVIVLGILLAAQASYGLYNSYLDSKIKELDIQLKQNELYQQMDLRNAFKPIGKKWTQESNKIMSAFDAPEIYYVKVNDTVIIEK
jgi:hypothetical protein